MGGLANQTIEWSNDFSLLSLKEVERLRWLPNATKYQQGIEALNFSLRIVYIS